MITTPPVQPKPLHRLALIFPWLNQKDLDALKADIKKYGLREPIATFGGEVVDGKNRQKACIAAGVEPRYRELEDEGIPKDQLVDYVRSANVHRRHLTAKEKRNAINQLLKQYPNWSDRKIGDAVDADHKTVAAERARAEACGEIPQTDQREDRKGHARPAHKQGRRCTAKKIPQHPKVPTVIDTRPATTLGPDEYTSTTESQSPKLSPIDEITETAAAAPASAAANAAVLKVDNFITDEALSTLDTRAERIEFYSLLISTWTRARAEEQSDAEPAREI